MDVQYDSSILREYAEKLYTQARWIALTTACTWAGVTAVAGWVVGAAGGTLERFGIAGDAATTLAGVGAVFGFVLGTAVGIRRGFNLRLDAQRTLCQVQIEENTRKANAAVAAEF